MSDYEKLDIVCRKCFRYFGECKECHQELASQLVYACDGKDHVCERCYDEVKA